MSKINLDKILLCSQFRKSTDRWNKVENFKKKDG